MARGPGGQVAGPRVQSAVSYAVLLTLLLIVVFPFFWMTITSFKNEDQMRSLYSMFWPSPFVGDNYRQLLGKTDFIAWYKNSIVVAVSSTLVATAIGTIGAYALARLRFLKLRTLPVGLSTFITGDVYGWGYLMAGAVLTTVPVIVAYMYLQRYMVEGLTAGSVKG